MQRTLTIFLTTILSIWVWALPVQAEEISVSTKVDAKQVSLGEALQLSVVVNGTQKAGPFNLPELDGFDIQYIGPSRNISIVNGSYSSSITYTYSLLPTREGRLAIPSLRVEINGESYTTDPIVIQVGGSADGSGASGENTLKDKIFLEVKTPKTEVFLNEPVPLKIFLYSTGVKVSDIQFPTLDNIGFTEEEFSKPKQYQQNINGRLFSIIEFSKTIYPTRTGPLTLGPATLTSNLVVEKKSSRRNNLFDDPFFSSFFGRQEKRAMTITSSKVELNVKDLPQKGQPKDFTGAVGQYSFDVDIGPSTDIQVGDPLTVKMKIGGRGNLQSAKFPKIQESQDFKLYDPNISEKPSLKEFEQVLIPTSEDVEELAALSFSYFDPAVANYQTVTKGPFPLNVSPSEDGGSVRMIGGDQPMTVYQPETIGEDIIFIKDEPGRIRTKGQHIYHHAVYWLLVVLTMALFVVSYIFYVRAHRLEHDSIYARAQKAPRAARTGLLQAEQQLQNREGKLFYDTVFKTLQSYLSDKCALPAGSITVANVREKIGAKKNSDVVLESLAVLFQECEMVRYASGGIEEQPMQDTFTRLQHTIQLMERMLS